MIVGEKNDDHVDYEVIGAGNLRISKSCTWQCGGEQGFSIGVEWGKNGYAGGLLPKDDAVMLARHIIRTVGLEEVVPD